jgi:hydroxypyruvate reductase
MTDEDAHAFLHGLVEAAITAADPASVLADHLPDKPTGRCIVVGAGKSAAAMAAAVERAWPDVDLSGLVVTRYGHSAPTSKVKVVEASHPVPDRAGLNAAQEILKLANSASADDLVLALISGGGSSLMPMPVDPITLEDKIVVNRLLLNSGLTISEMNKVRRRLSALKGGGLAIAAQPARVVTLAISDVPGDQPADIASGPTVPDPSGHEDLSPIVAKLGSDLPDTAKSILLSGPEKQTDIDVDFRLIATPMMALKAAASLAHASGVEPLILGDALEGEARDLGKVMAGIATSSATFGLPAKTPCVLLSGGETTVTIGDEKPGRGGRNTEFLLSFAIGLQENKNIYAAAIDTDGIDGTEDAAGAIIGPDFAAKCEQAQLVPAEFLSRHDSYSLFDALGSLIRTGPTLTNVNDFRAVLIL